MENLDSVTIGYCSDEEFIKEIKLFERGATRVSIGNLSPQQLIFLVKNKFEVFFDGEDYKIIRTANAVDLAGLVVGKNGRLLEK